MATEGWSRAGYGVGGYGESTGNVVHQQDGISITSFQDDIAQGFKVSGELISSSINSLTVTGTANVSLTGQVADGLTGTVVFDIQWSQNVPDQNGGYVTVSPSQDGGWTVVSPTQNANWG